MPRERWLTNPNGDQSDQEEPDRKPEGVHLSPFGTLTVALALAACGAAGAMAQQAPEPNSEKTEPNALTTLLPHQKGRALCYASGGAPVTFSLEDIPARKTPRRLTVRRFLFELTSQKFDDDDSTTPPTPGKAYYGFRMLAEVKGRKRRLIASGDCGSKDLTGFGCGVECDGGSVHFEPLKRGETLQMRVSDSANRFRMTWGCGEDEKYEVLNYDAATPAVRMDRADPKTCAAIARAFHRRK
jgi:hypothetical protein